jgi:hypothetical protein
MSEFGEFSMLFRMKRASLEIRENIPSNRGPVLSRQYFPIHEWSVVKSDQS